MKKLANLGVTKFELIPCQVPMYKLLFIDISIHNWTLKFVQSANLSHINCYLAEIICVWTPYLFLYDERKCKEVLWSLALVW